jgi:urea transport system substrate-binding protein
MRKSTVPTRRQFIGYSSGALFGLAAFPSSRAKADAEEFKVGMFLPQSGPASIFLAGGRACAELAVDEVNAGGGINGRKVRLVLADGGVAPAEAAKSAIRLILDERVDIIAGSHDGGVREALVSAIKGKVPYVFSPVTENGNCSANTYYLGETAQQQNEIIFDALVKPRNLKSFYLIGNDYSWPRAVNENSKKFIAESGGKIVGEEYVPFGTPNRFEEIVTRIKSVNPDVILITLVGGDNVTFNRTFGAFGTDGRILRVGYLLEEQTLAGIGADGSRNLFSALGYFSTAPGGAGDRFKQAFSAKFGETSPQLFAQVGTIGVDSYAAVHFARALIAKAGSTKARDCMAASEGLSFTTATGPAVMMHRYVNRTMYLAECKGTTFSVVATKEGVQNESSCKT